MIRQRLFKPDITTKSNGFGVDVQVNRSPLPKVNHLPNGDEHGTTTRAPLFTGYREVIPPGNIGSQEDIDPQIPAPQYVDTVPSYPTEQNDTRLHGPMAALRGADTQSIPFQEYQNYQPRSAPMPRNESDDVCLPYKSNEHAADPLMNDNDSGQMWNRSDEGQDPFRKDLYGPNRDGVLHNPIGGNPPAPTTPGTTAAAAQSVNRQVGRGMLRTPHGQRPPELADKPIDTGKLKA
jgi:hypothetical protein